jgi:hypothetical protein
MLILFVYLLVAVAFESDLLQGAQPEFELDAVIYRSRTPYYVSYALPSLSYSLPSLSYALLNMSYTLLNLSLRCLVRATPCLI